MIDEADLILSYGHSSDMKVIAKSMPKVCQTLLMSATLSSELDDLRRVVLHSPAILKLQEAEEASAHIQQWCTCPFAL